MVDCDHAPPLSKHLSAALPVVVVSCFTCSAPSQLAWQPSTRALIAALQVMMTTYTVLSSISSKIPSAGCHAPPFSQAPITMLQRM